MTIPITKKRMKLWIIIGVTLLVTIYLYKTLAYAQKVDEKSVIDDQPPRPKTPTVLELEQFQGDLHTIYKQQQELIQQQRQELQRTKEQLTKMEDQIRVLQSTKPRKYRKVKYLNYKNRKRILITGGAGFVGSHLVDDLMVQGHEVIVVDNFFTGRKRNVEHWLGHENFELIHHDIVNPLFIEVDEIYHLASPASPPHYMYNPVKTIKTNTMGTINVLGLAKRVMARVLIASTSEVYGDPTVHPQPETYWGHVNPIGPRACYDEGKRVSETLSYAYAKQVS